MYAKLLKFTYNIEHNNVISSIRRGFILLIPALLLGSFSLLIRSFPLTGFQDFLGFWANGVLLKILNFLFDSTIGFMSVYLVLSITYYYSRTIQVKNHFLQIMAMIVSMVCFAASFGGAGSSMELADLGPVGVFTAMITAILATKLFYLFHSWVGGSFRFRTPGSDMDYRNSLAAFFPLLFCSLIFIGLHLFIQLVFRQDNINDLITNSIIYIFQNLSGDLSVGVLFVFILNFFWFFGIHGGNAMEQVAQTYLTPANASAELIVSKSFLDNFALIGGCGTSICLLIALLLFTKTKTTKQLVRSSAPAIFFNINEILVYGLPIVLNPMMLIPFILTPICALLIAYGATVSGFIPVVTESVTWTTPIFFSGYLTTGSMHGVIVQMFILAVGTAIYAPFVSISERIKQNQASFILGELTEFFRTHQDQGIPCNLLDRHDSIGLLAKNLAEKLRLDVESGSVPLEYQPQFHYEKGLIGAEALLRWSYMDQLVYAPLVVAIAQEDGFFDRMTQCILRTSMEACKTLIESNQGINISANITAEQLNSRHFIDFTIHLADEYGVADYFCLEITEETSIDQMEAIPLHVQMLKEKGISIALDDFSMGHTSLKYLQNNCFDIVKLDGELVSQVIRNYRIKEIILSIVSLGQNLGFSVLAEYVENKEIRDDLHGLGCDLYQGYLYSPSVPLKGLKELLHADRGNEFSNTL